MAHAASMGGQFGYNDPYQMPIGIEFILFNNDELAASGTLDAGDVLIDPPLPTKVYIERLWMSSSWNLNGLGGTVTITFKTNSGADTLFSFTVTDSINTALISEELDMIVDVVSEDGIITIDYVYDFDATDGFFTYEFQGWARVVPTDI